MRFLNTKTKLLAGLVVALPLFTVACSKKEAPVQEQVVTEQTPATTGVTAEQQAAIDSIDQPNPDAIHVEDEVTSAEATAETTPAIAEQSAVQPEANEAAQ